MSKKLSVQHSLKKIDKTLLLKRNHGFLCWFEQGGRWCAELRVRMSFETL